MKVERFLVSTPTQRWLNTYSDYQPTSGSTGSIFESGTWTPPTPGTYEIHLVGGGGGGAGWYGAGGGAGNWVTQNIYLNLQPYTITIGNGGAGSGSGTGSTGGTTIINDGVSNLFSATGGAGGVTGGKGGDGGSGGGAVCDLSNSRGAWGGGGGGHKGSNGGYSPYKQVGTNGAQGIGAQSVFWGKGTQGNYPSGGHGTGRWNYIAGFGGGDGVEEFTYSGIYGYGKGRGGDFGTARNAIGRGTGGGGANWAVQGSAGRPGMMIWKLLVPAISIPSIGTPTNISATDEGSGRAFNNGQSTISWSPPDNTSGSPVTFYSIISNPSGFAATTTSNSITATGLLSNTSYTFSVIANTSEGYGPTGSSNSVLVTTVPQSPTLNSTTVNSTTSVSVNFTAPVNNGGKTITGYTATASPAGFSNTGSSSPITVTGSYPSQAGQVMSIYATNSNGNSLSVSGSTVFPNGMPATGFTSTTTTTDLTNSAFTALYSGSRQDEGNVSATLPFSVLWFGVTYTTIKISSNSYFAFGSPAFPGYSWSPTVGPGVGVCCHPGSSTDANYQFVGYRTDNSTYYTLRWAGGYPYSFSTVNRLWEVTFYPSTSLHKIELRLISAKDASGQGNNVIMSNGTTGVYSLSAPTDNTAYLMGASSV